MSVGRYAMRSRVFQGWAFATRALAGAGSPVTVSADGEVIVATNVSRVAIGRSMKRIASARVSLRVAIGGEH